MSWHGTKGFPGGREIKLDPGLESSTAIYASLNLLSSTSTTRRRHPPRFTSPSPTATTVTTPPFRCSSPLSATRGSPGSVVPNLRLEVSPASCYQDDYFFIFYAPPTATSHHLVRHALAEFAPTLANVEGSSRFFHHSNPLCRLLLGPAVKELSPFSGPFYLEMKI